ncbi:PREDICTED: olfactory receptor 52L1-like [Bison bison bison]|uniref:Olfactory receptor 52L1-like n=1 Tax=Bison bison bison TaxID=43346 RepID=A0A6P3GMK7_BISBB|nr:PREDICTED: olfactory receptor 52L1-like [Bison bison bison]
MTTLSNSSWRLIEPSFFLIGIPGLEESQHWIALPLCVLYLLALLGNVTVLFTIWTDPSLHQPMYLFLAMLSGTDLVLASSTAPKTLAVLLVHAHEIGYTVCLIQMFFIHAFSSMESGVLVAMALDRYVAVLKVPGGEARLKAFSTCGSHICVILVFYVPGMFSFLTHRFGRQVPHHVHVLLATLYLLVPPALNPLVYGVKTQQIRQRVLRVFDIKGQI